MSERPQVKPFEYSPEDPLAGAHGHLNEWIEETTARGLKPAKFMELPLKDYASGQRMLKKKGVACVEQLQAALQQEEYWRVSYENLRDKSEMDYFIKLKLKSISSCYCALSTAVAKAMLRQKPPFGQKDIKSLAHWFLGHQSFIDDNGLSKLVIQTIVKSIKEIEISEEMRNCLTDLSRDLKDRYLLEKFADHIENILAPRETFDLSSLRVVSPRLPTPQPAPYGDRGVMIWLKRKIGMIPANETFPEPEYLGPEAFPVSRDSPLYEPHLELNELVEEQVSAGKEADSDLELYKTGKAILKKSPINRGLMLRAIMERSLWGYLLEQEDYTPEAMYAKAFVDDAYQNLRKHEHEMDREGFFDQILYHIFGFTPSDERFEKSLDERLIKLIHLSKSSPCNEGERYVLARLRREYASYLTRKWQHDSRLLTILIGDNFEYLLSPGEFWADRFNEELSLMPEDQRELWRDLILHCREARSTNPAAKWLTKAKTLLNQIGINQAAERITEWLRLIDHPGPSVDQGLGGQTPTAVRLRYINEPNSTALRGLLWLITLLPYPADYSRLITEVTLSAYKKIPRMGPRAIKVGNAGVYALAQMGTLESLGQLAMLKVRVKSVPAQKEIEKAFNTLSESLGLPREEIEELGVPSYGLEEVGLLREELGGYRGEVRVDGSSVQLRWFDSQGKELKSVPAKVKAEHKEELKDLQQSVKDINGMLPAQRERLDGIFCSRKTWKYSVWRERYLDHPLVGTIARRLIWNVGERSAIFSEGRLVDRGGAEVVPEGDMEVSLWHPIGRVVEEITGWRERLEGLGITQPFKQAHREIYLLTDAERNTNVYSNRFAAHIIRQHQFNALCGVRGWKNKLRMMVDAEYPPAEKHLPEWGLRAEYWIEGIGENYGTDTNEAGAFLRLATDQVRFYRTGAARNESQAGEGRYVAGRREELGAQDRPIPLEEIPPLVFSEIMREVDLFVGVCSVANDPAWQDGGVVPQYRAYWESYSFGRLSGSSTVRKEVLERLIPRLKIADRCSFADRFLVVKGSKRTYKIHLGSGNILMEPNDQYLCIVPDPKSKVVQGDLYLPFEGDNMLSIILSKALLLAEDTKIKDPTIVRQIEGI